MVTQGQKNYSNNDYLSLEPVKGDVHYHSSIIENKQIDQILICFSIYFFKDDTIKNNIALGVDEKILTKRVLEN